MLSWKKSCVALALAGVVSSSVLHGQLLAAGKKRVLGDYQSQPSMDRIRNKLLDRYGSMIPESPEPAEEAATPAVVVTQPSKPAKPVSPAPHSNATVVPQSIVPTNVVTTKPQAAKPAPVQSTVVAQPTARQPQKTPEAVPLAPLPAPVLTQTRATLPKTMTSQSAPTTTAERTHRPPAVSQESWVATQPAVKTAPVVKTTPVAPVATTAKETEKLPKLPEIAVETKPTQGNEPYYPGLQNRTALIVQSAPVPAQPKVSAPETRQASPVATTARKASEPEVTVVAPKVLPKIDDDVAGTEPTKMPHHRPASPPSAGQAPYRPRMVENVASPLARPTPVAEPAVLTKAEMPVRNLAPSKEPSVPAPAETASIEIVETKPIVAPPKRDVAETPVKTVEPTVAAAEPAVEKAMETTDGNRRIIFVPPAPKIETAKPIVPRQSHQAVATKRTRSLMKPGETKFAPPSGSAGMPEAPAAVVAEKGETKGKETNLAATPKPVVTPSKPTVAAKEKTPALPKTKPVASEETYAARIAATYDNVVSEGKQPMQPLVEAPEPRRSTLPGTSPVPVAKKADKPAEKAVTTASKEFPPAKGEMPVKPATPVAKPVTPVADAAKKGLEGSPGGLSFVMERARQGSLLINESVPPAPPAVATSAPKPTEKAEVLAVSAPRKEAAPVPGPTAVVTAAVKEPGVQTDSKPVPVVRTEAVAKAEPAKVELPKFEAPTKTEPVAKSEVMTITAAKPVWSEPKSNAKPTAEMPAVAPVKVANPYAKEVPATPETVMVERLPTVKSATTPTPKEVAKVPATPVTPTKVAEPVKTVVPAEPTKVALSRLEASKEVVSGPTAVAKTTSNPTTVPTEAVKQPAVKPQKAQVDVAAVHRHLETLRKSGVDQERLKSLEGIAQIPGWEDVKTVGPVLRNIAMTDYNTHLRLSAVQMLGKMKTDRRMVVEALHISAEYDSDVTIRSTAMKLLDQIAAAPAETHLR